jgi:hypothetical protein
MRSTLASGYARAAGLALIGIAATTCALSVGGAAAATSADRTCRSAYETITANKSVRVFRRRVTDGNLVEYVNYACYLRRPFKVRKLGRWDRFDCGVYGFQLAGRYVAYDDFECSGEGFPCQVVVRDMKSGKARRSAPCTQPTGVMTDLGLRSNGSVAWIRQLGGDPKYEVWKLDSGGEARLDAGAGVDPTSLAVSGARFYWTSGDEPRSAPLN